MTHAKTKPAAEPTPKSRRLEIIGRAGVSEDRLVADMLTDGESVNASTALRFAHADHGGFGHGLGLQALGKGRAQQRIVGVEVHQQAGQAGALLAGPAGRPIRRHRSHAAGRVLSIRLPDDTKLRRVAGILVMGTTREPDCAGRGFGRCIPAAPRHFSRRGRDEW